MRLLLAVMLGSGCIWVSDDELVTRQRDLKDMDGDGYPSTQYQGRDCDDSNALVHPDASEEPYDGIDNDCNPLSPDDDLDADGFLISRDCDDTDPEVHPDATEVCDGVDNDCDEQSDDSSAQDAVFFYEDADGDGYGSQVDWTVACEAASGQVAASDDSGDFDCDDTNAEIFPGADEYCDDVDNDCDAVIDEQGAIDQKTWYPDLDGDGYGGSSDTQQGCEAPSGYLEVGGDCEDGDPNMHPGALESLGDLEDRDCDGSDDGFAFDTLETHDAVSLTGPRMVMANPSSGPLLYIAWLASKCRDEEAADKEDAIRSDCMLFSTYDFSTWETVQEGEQDYFIQSTTEEVEYGVDGDFVANEIYAAWVRDVVGTGSPELRVFGFNRVTEEYNEHVMLLPRSEEIDRVQAGLSMDGDEILSALTCSEDGTVSFLQLALDDMVDDEESWIQELTEPDVYAEICEVDAYHEQVFTGDYGNQFITWDLVSEGHLDGPILSQASLESGATYLDIEHTLTESVSALAISQYDSASRLYYAYEMIDEELGADEEITQESDWVYTSQVFYSLDLAVTEEGMGWICGISSSNEPYLVSVNLGGINPVQEYPLSTTVGLGVVDDCSITTTRMDQVWMSTDGHTSTIRSVPVIIVAFRSENVVKWGVVEAY